MKTTREHFFEQLDAAFERAGVLATAGMDYANVGTISLTDPETGGVIGAVHVDIQNTHATCKARPNDMTGSEGRVSIYFSPTERAPGRFDPPTGIDRIVMLALGGKDDCTCTWSSTQRTVRRDEQYGEPMCPFHKTLEVQTPEPVVGRCTECDAYVVVRHRIHSCPRCGNPNLVDPDNWSQPLWPTYAGTP